LGHTIESSRNHCALLGALQTLQAVRGIVPIIHSTAGCGMQHYLGGSKAGGWQGTGYAGGSALPSSNIIEKQIVFGGTSRLREQIKNTVKVLPADLYTVLSGCATELVGDDIPAMVKEAQEQGFPVIYAATPGFKGDVHLGYELIVKSIFDQLAVLSETDLSPIPGLINILGIIPGQDVFWQGNLLELQHILTQVGLSVNTLFGFGNSTADWQQVPRAQLNVSFSPSGTMIANYLARKFGTPCLNVDYIPIGAEAVLQFLDQLQNKICIDEARLTQFQILARQSQAYYLDKIADIYVEQHLQKEFAVVGEVSMALGLIHFLSNTMGLIPQTVIITEPLASDIQSQINDKIKQIIGHLATDINFVEDQGQINTIIRKNGPELILGSSLEQEIADELGIPLLAISFPITSTAILNKTYIGLNGAITLLEDIGNQILTGQNSI